MRHIILLLLSTSFLLDYRALTINILASYHHECVQNICIEYIYHELQVHNLQCMVFRMSSASASFFHNWHNALPAIYLGPSMLPLPGLLKTWLSSNLYLCQFVWGLSSAVHVLVQCTSTCTADVHCACWIRIRSNLVMLSGSLVACLGAFTSSWCTS